MKRISKVIAVIFTIAYLIPNLAHASPIFSIGEGGDKDWNQAVSDGDIAAAANALSGEAAQGFYADQIGIMGVTNIVAAIDTQIVAAGSISDGITSHDALLMSWDGSDAFNPTDLVVAAWDYVYGVDPDLTGTMIHFSARAPTGIWDLSLELFDIFGNSRGWFAATPPPAWTNYWIDPSVAGAQGPFNAFYQSAGFDLTQVISIRLNESSMGGTAFIDLNPMTGLTTPWNAWNHLSVTSVPLPPAIWLFGTGLLGLLSITRKQKH